MVLARRPGKRYDAAILLPRVLREWLSSVLVLALAAGGALGWYVLDREGALSAAQLDCQEPRDAPHLRLDVDEFSLRQGSIATSVVLVNAGAETVHVWEGQHNATLYRERWDGLLVHAANLSEPGYSWEGYEGTDVPPGEAWPIAHVFFPLAESADDWRGGYLLVVASQGLCGSTRVVAG